MPIRRRAYSAVFAHKADVRSGMPVIITENPRSAKGFPFRYSENNFEGFFTCKNSLKTAVFLTSISYCISSIWKSEKYKAYILK